MIQVRKQREVNFSQTALFPWGVDPSEMGEMRIDRTCYDLSVDFPELLYSIAEGEDFGWTDEGTKKFVFCKAFHIATPLLTNLMGRKRRLDIFLSNRSILTERIPHSPPPCFPNLVQVLILK